MLVGNKWASGRFKTGQAQCWKQILRVWDLLFNWDESVRVGSGAFVHSFIVLLINAPPSGHRCCSHTSLPSIARSQCPLDTRFAFSFYVLFTDCMHYFHLNLKLDLWLTMRWRRKREGKVLLPSFLRDGGETGKWRLGGRDGVNVTNLWAFLVSFILLLRVLMMMFWKTSWICPFLLLLFYCVLVAYVGCYVFECLWC